jgi:uncharacterized protein YdeI (YjbR/CyaY-like superfamily)
MAMPTHNFNPKVDAYIAKVQPFAQPIMTRLRGLVHRGCPGAEESIKWGMPFFEYRSAILCNMAAFKQHCRFGFWGKEIATVLREAKVPVTNSADSLGRITRVDTLPSDKQMIEWVRQAAAFIESGNYTSPIAARNQAVKTTPKKPAVKMSSPFAVALKKNKKAATVFAAFSPSAKREYIEWIAGAKRPETRDKRIATAIEWISQGKQRNWKYQNC